MLQYSCQVRTFMQKLLSNTSKLQMTVKVSWACHFYAIVLYEGPEMKLLETISYFLF